MNKIIILIFSSMIFYGCMPVKDSDYFKGGISTVYYKTDDIKQIDLKEVVIDHPLNQGGYIYDSLLINYNDRGDYQFNIININNGLNLGDFCSKGNANNEVYCTTPISSVFKQNNCLKTIIIDPGKSQLYKWNITKSLRENKTIFDTITPLKDIDGGRAYYDYYEYIDNSTMFTYTPSRTKYLKSKTPTLPVMKLRSIYSDSLLQEFVLYKDVFPNEDNVDREGYNVPSKHFFNSLTSVSPNRSYVVQSMLYIGQLNILNVSTGEIKGIRLAESPDFSIFANAEDIKKLYFYGGLFSTNDRIYAGYSGRERNNPNNMKFILVFDWNGKLLDVYDIGIEAMQLLYDDANNVFYCLTSEKLFKFKI